jgi:hypothetical protein
VKHAARLAEACPSFVNYLNAELGLSFINEQALWSRTGTDRPTTLVASNILKPMSLLLTVSHHPERFAAVRNNRG